MNRLIYFKKIELQSFILTLFALFSFLLVYYNDTLIGYAAVPILILSYFILTYYYIRIAVSSHSVLKQLLTILCSLWIIYGITIDLFFSGLNPIMMILFFSLSLIIQVYTISTSFKSKVSKVKRTTINQNMM